MRTQYFQKSFSELCRFFAMDLLLDNNIITEKHYKSRRYTTFSCAQSKKILFFFYYFFFVWRVYFPPPFSLVEVLEKNTSNQKRLTNTKKT